MRSIFYHKKVNRGISDIKKLKCIDPREFGKDDSKENDIDD